jgi:nickel-dependent lactate racemase
MSIIKLAYGQGHLAIDAPEKQTAIIQPRHQPGLANEKMAVIDMLDHPIAARPLREWIGTDTKVCVVFTDITRATPNDRLIPWLMEYLRQVDPNNVILLNSTGTHRPNTPTELEKMLTAPICHRYRVVNHDCHQREDLTQLGTTSSGAPVLLNRYLVDADVRILTGFIEPHFFAGFSGGPKAILPGVAGLETVMSNHNARLIGHPEAGWGITRGNPLWEEMMEIARRLGPSFLFNVTLNEQREITGVFAGDLELAHRAGCEFVRNNSMQRVDQLFDLVITSNSGYPLDLNLYQGIKGISAAARIVKPGGAIVLAAECREGTPPGSPFDQLLRKVKSPEEILELIQSPGFCHAEQWQAQIQAQVQRVAKVKVYSSLADEIIRAAHMEPIHSIEAEIAACIARHGEKARIAVLPQGPLTIPYLSPDEK